MINVNYISLSGSVIVADQALASNLKQADYVAIVCGAIERLPEAFARLDERAGQKAWSSVSISSTVVDAETASLSTADRKLVRSEEMTRRVIDAAKVGARERDAA